MMAAAFGKRPSSERNATMLNAGFHYVAIGAVSIAWFGAGPSWAQGPATAASGEYNPVINPEDFVPEINNKYFTLKPGTKFMYRNKAGTERIEVSVTDQTRKVMGVTARGVRVTEWRNDRLKEDTTDWYAQDKAGNVWYFGESVNNYRDGKLVHQWGSWEAGTDGAKPGIIMQADPKVGQTYRQEHYPGQAEDMGTVIAINTKVTVPYGTLDNCLQVQDWSRLEAGRENKYYCPDIAFLALEELAGFGPEAELVSISRP
jgi:hypothetical protein